MPPPLYRFPPTTIRKQHMHSPSFIPSCFLHRLFIICNHLIYLLLVFLFFFLGGVLFSTLKCKLHDGGRFVSFYIADFQHCLLHCRQSIPSCRINLDETPQQHYWMLASNGAMTSKIWENMIFNLECQIINKVWGQKRTFSDMWELEKFTFHIPFLRSWAGSNEKKY